MHGLCIKYTTLNQLCVLIAKAVSHESHQPDVCHKSHRPAGENTAELLSPVSVSSQPGAQNALQQDGVLSSCNPLVTRPLEVSTVMPGLLPSSLLPVAHPQSNPLDPHLPPLPQKLKNKILKHGAVPAARPSSRPRQHLSLHKPGPSGASSSVPPVSGHC